MKAVFAALALAIAATTPAASQTAPSSIALQYQVSAGPFSGEASYNFSLNGGTYEGRSSRRLTGLARTIAGDSQDYSYSVRGAVAADGTVRPQAYQHEGGRRDRVVRTAFTATDAVTTSDPPMGMGNPPATAAQKAGSMDQVSMFLAMALQRGEPCQGTLRVLMDGRSRVDFVMSPNGSQRVSIAGFRGEAARCRVQYRPIAGFSDPAQTMNLTFLFAPLNGINAPLRIEIPGEDNRVFVLQARSVTVR